MDVGIVESDMEAREASKYGLIRSPPVLLVQFMRSWIASAIDVSVTLLAKSFDAPDNVPLVTSMQGRTSFALLLSIDVPGFGTADRPLRTMTSR